MRLLAYLVFFIAGVSALFKLSLIHSGYLRGNYLPIQSGSPCSNVDDPKCSGGLWHRAERIWWLRNRVDWPNSVLVECGNFVQGTFFSSIIMAEGAYFFWDLMGYDMVSLGPRDLDFISREDINEIIGRQKFPTILSSGNFSQSPYNNTVRYTTVAFGEEKIGFFQFQPNFKISSNSWPPQVQEQDVLHTFGFALDALLSMGKI
eukprot:TRINITY_DN5341_c0_g1_i2.p1 TRINITY_DN5341_c0_g1~~TRINITY_DN5341_c0_g1_i2.p1  ORF type:complete len:204 (+),score=28.04 TRINITY_DN5341_c0_g1_i2:40-651(+)